MIPALNLAVAVVGVCLIALCFWIGLRRPTLAIGVLLLVLPFHTFTIVMLRHWLGTNASSLTVLGLWKEGLVVGLALPALAQMALGRRDKTSVLAVALAAFVTLFVPLSLGGHPASAVLVDWRGIALAPLAFVAVRLRGAELAASRRLIAGYVGVAVAIALYSFVQVFVLGFSFLMSFYREPGEALATAYKVGLQGFEFPRAIGTYVAPNEFGLFLATATFGYLAVYVARWGRIGVPAGPWRWNPRSASSWRSLLWRREMLPAVAAVVLLAALLLSYSRSAWVASGVACLVLAVGLGVHRVVAVWIQDKPRAHLPIVGAAVLGVLAVATMTGVLQLLFATVTGTESSAAGRGSSIANGVDAVLRHPLGMGLASAGPRAYGVDPHAVRTEMWYLVVIAEIGVIGGVLLLATLAAITSQLMRAWRTQERSGAVPATGVWLGALAGALFIPALFDVPTILPIWILAGLVVRSALPLPELAPEPLARWPRLAAGLDAALAAADRGEAWLLARTAAESLARADTPPRDSRHGTGE